MNKHTSKFGNIGYSRTERLKNEFSYNNKKFDPNKKKLAIKTKICINGHEYWIEIDPSV